MTVERRRINDERQVLSAFPYSRNTTVLHSDTALLPRARGARASWNYLMASCTAPADEVQVSYHMNRLQRLDTQSLGDFQLARFKADPAHRGRVMDRGLWGWTRHPNYFGDFLVWWGLFLLACGTAQSAALAVVSLLVMSLLLMYGSGKRLLENHLADRPGYAAYRARTSGFVPLPPRRRPHTEDPRP